MSEEKKKKKKSSSDEKKSRSSSKRDPKDVKDTTPQPQSHEEKDVAYLDFETGSLFARYDSTNKGSLTPEEFRQMWRDAVFTETNRGIGELSIFNQNYRGDELSFEAGQIFAKYDHNKSGRLHKSEFWKLVRDYPQLLALANHSRHYSSVLLPTEVITGSLLTHYDETAGVAIPRSAVEVHKSMGNIINPLAESYRTRYDRLRALVTGRLLPRRENLIQIRRHLQDTSIEVEATRKAIERETLTDADQILERLRNAESLRQSAIKHQIIQLEEELQSIERLIRRVEQANDEALGGGVNVGTTRGVLFTSAAPGHPPLEAIRYPRAALMVELIQQFSDLTGQIERLATKAVSVQVDFPTDDLPKETADRLEIIARCDRYAHALSVKDHMLWAALQDKDHNVDLLQEERQLSHDYAQEVAKWAELSQSLKDKIEIITKEKAQVEEINNDLLSILREHNIFYVPKR